jgi:hypothetical protein
MDPELRGLDVLGAITRSATNSQPFPYWDEAKLGDDIPADAPRLTDKDHEELDTITDEWIKEKIAQSQATSVSGTATSQ